MNLDESDEYKVKIEKNLRHRRNVAYSIGLCAILVGLLVILIVVIQYQDKVTMKYFVNNSQVSIPSHMIEDIDGEKYVDIQAFGSLIGGYNYHKGEYKKYNENADSCYIENGFETVAITADKDYYIKYTTFTNNVEIAGFKVTTKTDNGYSEYFFIDKPIKLVNDEDKKITNKLYVSLDDVEEMFNVAIDWSNEYRLKIFTLEKIVSNSLASINKAGYQNIDGNYENLKAILDGYAIVSDDSSPALYGVIVLGKKKGEAELVGVKYSDIRYTQNLKEFYLTSQDGVGIVDAQGNQFVQIDKGYKSISILDEKNRLYLVEKEKQFGVVDSEGNEIIYPEYDQLGVDVSKFEYDELINGNLLFGKCIPFYRLNEQGEKTYGLIGIDGKEVPDFSCDGFGYLSLNSSQSATRDRNTLLIPESIGIKGIIYNRDYMSSTGNNTEKRYGIYIVDGKDNTPNIPASFAKIYVAVKEGKTDYYLETINGQTLLLKDYLEENGYIKPKTLVTSEPILNTNTVTNTIMEGNTVSEGNTINENTVENKIIENTVSENPIENEVNEVVNNSIVGENQIENVNTQEIQIVE